MKKVKYLNKQHPLLAIYFGFHGTVSGILEYSPIREDPFASTNKNIQQNANISEEFCENRLKKLNR